MKRFNSILICFLFFAFSAIAQVLPNSNFEDWTQLTLFEQPDSFVTSNPQLAMMGMPPNCIKVTDSYTGNFAARLETVSNGQDTVNGILLVGMPGNQTIDGGYPFAARPDTVIVRLKYNIQPNDTGHFIIFFKSNTAIIGSTGMNIIGTQATYGVFKLPVFWNQPGNADTIAALISSSNLDYPEVPGSYIILDNITMTGTSLPFPNGDFEHWTAAMSEEPDYWQTLNYAKTTVPSAAKSADSFSGSYALRLETILTLWGQTLGYITNGIIGDHGPEGGVPISYNPYNVTGFYKYVPNGPDTALAVVTTSRYDIVLDSTIVLDMALIKLTPSNTYIPFTVTLTYNGFPPADTVNVSFASSNLMDSLAYVGLGSALYIDSLNINLFPVNTINLPEEDMVQVYPVPAGDFVTIVIPVNCEVKSISFFNSIGQQVKEVASRVSTGSRINIQGFLPGIYTLKIVTENGKVFLKKIVVR